MKKIILIILTAVCVSCSTKPGNEKMFELPDSLFLVEKLKKADLSSKGPQANFTSLNKEQKLKLVVPILTKELRIDSAYVLEFMNSRFISKQKTANGFTVVTLRVNGDDYDALFYVVLDENNDPLSYFRLSGGFCAGPDEMNNDFMRLCPVRYSFLDNDKIHTHILTERMFTGTPQRPSVIDSVYYQSSVSPKGEIKTLKIDSVRYLRKVNEK